MIFVKSIEVEAMKTSVIKDYVVPLGSLFIPTIAFLTQNTSSWWGSLAIVAYMIIVVVFLVVPAIIRLVKKWKENSERVRLEKIYLPKIVSALRRFIPMMESNRTDTIWSIWDNASKTSEMQSVIRPNHTHAFTLAAWLNHLIKNIDSAKSSNFPLFASEVSAWVQQYAAFCRDAYMQFEELIRSNQLDESKIREVKQNWNHARDQHNQAINNWMALCSEIRLSFELRECFEYYETLKPLE